LQALLAKITERQEHISGARDRSRTLVKPSELREAQQEIQDGIDEVTAICKGVKVKLDELDLINAELLSDDREEVSREAELRRWTRPNPLGTDQGVSGDDFSSTRWRLIGEVLKRVQENCSTP